MVNDNLFLNHDSCIKDTNRMWKCLDDDFCKIQNCDFDFIYSPSISEFFRIKKINEIDHSQYQYSMI